MEEGQRAWWCAHVVQLIFSVAATVASGAYVAAHPNAFSAAAPPPSVALPSAIVCATAGFCAFQLWLLIMTHRRSYLRMAHLSVVLMIFAAAAHKGDHTALLTALLLSEGHTVCTVAGRLQVRPPPPPPHHSHTHSHPSINSPFPARPLPGMRNAAPASALRWASVHLPYQAWLDRLHTDKLGSACVACDPLHRQRGFALAPQRCCVKSLAVILNSKLPCLHGCPGRALPAPTYEHCMPQFDGMGPQDAYGVQLGGRLSSGMRAAERAALVVLRIVPQATALAVVGLQPAAFASRARHSLAVAGLLYVNAANGLTAWRTFRPALRRAPRSAADRKRP